MSRFLIAMLLAALMASIQGVTGVAEARHHESADKKTSTEAAGTEEAAKEEKDKDKKWDIEEPGFPTREIDIDVTEGTWMSLDVSPDGQHIVFDMIGDIYIMPITGGEAKSLTSGMAWDEHPRFSPDGTQICYASDRDGADNIWIINVDGSDPQQVTKEDFRLLNSPDWTPDGEYIVARKHFTSTRSAGAGEMWLYHKSGGKGMKMTKRASDQKDSGEPAFSPDGKYLYYSEDVTPGARFLYNKDPNTQIYAIKRLDLETGDVERFVTGAGGSIRPTPSPDGKQLAFVRRVRYQSVLYVVDIESGIETALYDELDRDLQETWAIHGVFPGISWTPDNKSIVFWSGGKIQSVDVETRMVTAIPFHVKDTRTIGEAVVCEVPVSPETFHTKMLRWVSVSPKGDKVVYQTLGHLYVRDLPDGTPKRLTKQDDHFEFYPSWSRDGKHIVYTTWSDKDLGTLRVVSSKGGKGKQLNDKPGHFVEPAFSPDGKTVVYRGVRGGYLRSPHWSRKPGIYSIPAKGGEATFLARSGYEPHFGSRNDEVYVIRVGGSDSDDRSLVALKLDGTDEHTVANGVYFTEMKVSPDGNWIAFREDFKAYVAPFKRMGNKFSVGPGKKSVPVKQVSKSAGEYLHWSGDSGTLHWSMGPELFTRPLSDTYAFVDGAPEELPEAPAHGIDVGFDAPTDVPDGTVAFRGAQIITMNGEEIIQNGTIVVTDNKITAVGGADTAIPDGATILDATGKTIMPGLIDVHWHGAMGSEEMTPQQNWELYSTLAFGVTTIHDPSNDTSEIFAVSEMAKAGITVGPRTYSTGTILYGAKGSFKAKVNNYQDAYDHLERLKAVGAFSVKSYNQPRRNQRQQVLKAAHELDMRVYPEGGSLFQHNMNMIIDGHTGLEHSIPIAAIYDDIVQMWSQTDVAYTPTLGVGYGGIWGENYWYGHTQVWANERLQQFVPRRLLDARARRPMIAPQEEYGHIRNANIANQLREAGVRVQIGAHGQREGLAAHWEIWMFEQGGMTPHQALYCATMDGAHYLGMESEIGSLEVGKLADFIVLDADPLQNIRNSEQVRYTVLNGRVYDAMTMNEIGNHAHEREEFFWESDGQAYSYQELFTKQIGCSCH